VDEEVELTVRRHDSDTDERHIVPITLDVVDPCDVKGSCLVLRKRHRDIFGKNWKLRWVVISGDRVGVFKKEGSMEAKYWLSLPDCEVIEAEVVNRRYKVHVLRIDDMSFVDRVFSCMSQVRFLEILHSLFSCRSTAASDCRTRTPLTTSLLTFEMQRTKRQRRAPLD
jgi:hypothetical protein